MSWFWQIALFGVLVLLPWALNAFAARADFVRFSDAAYMSGLVVAIWCVTNTIGLFVPAPESKTLHAPIDTAALAIVLNSLKHRWGWWKAILAALFAAQIGMHASFWLPWFLEGRMITDPIGRDAYKGYMTAINTVWLMQLIALSWPGGGHVAGRAFDRMRHRRRLASGESEARP